MFCLQVQAVIVVGKPPPSSTILVEDVVEIMIYRVGDEEKLIAHGKVINLERETVHEVLIYKGCLFVKAHKTEDDEYVLFKNVKIDDPPMQKIGEAVGYFILWPT